MNTLSVAVLVVALASAGGVAYACGGSSGGCNGGNGGNGGNCQNSAGLVWTNPSGVTPGTGVSCVLTLTSSQLTVAVAKLAPGLGCTFHAALENTGQVTLSLSEEVSTHVPSTCTLFTYSDNIPATPAHQLNPSASYAFQGSIQLGSTAGKACEGAVATFTVTITGTQVQPPCGGQSELVPALAAAARVP